jgi:hypothetical protein
MPAAIPAEVAGAIRSPLFFAKILPKGFSAFLPE